MKPAHVNPEEAVEIHKDVMARNSVAIHWGTFILTDEPADEPPLKLEEALKKNGLGFEDFSVYRHGETRIYKSQDR